MGIALGFLFPVFIGLYFLIGAVSGRLGGGGRGGRGKEGGFPIPNWARVLCLLPALCFGALPLYGLLRHFNFRLLFVEAGLEPDSCLMLVVAGL